MLVLLVLLVAVAAGTVCVWSREWVQVVEVLLLLVPRGAVGSVDNGGRAGLGGAGKGRLRRPAAGSGSARVKQLAVAELASCSC